MAGPCPLAINAATMGRYVTELGRCGEQPGGGLIRPMYGEAWAEARDLLAGWMRDAGLEVRSDSVGNLFGRLAGRDDRRTVLTGSHIDTVRLGGKYDGALGILSGLAALAALREQVGVPARSLEVVALCEEEGSRFHANYFGSRAILGLVDGAEPETLLDEEGVALADAMREVGLDPARYRESVRDDIDTFLELHIEQGPVLYEEGTDIGVVTGITALCWLSMTVTGRADHAGTTPMDARRDALQAAARMAQEVAAVARDRRRPAVATVGKWDVRPGGANIVPEQVVFSVDVRHADEAELTAMLTELRARCDAVAREEGLGLDVQMVKREAATPTDAGLQQLLAEAAEDCGASWRHLPSGAGHDSQLFACRLPTAMLFVPSVDGRSHSAAEHTPDEACALGARVLAAALHRLAYA